MVKKILQFVLFLGLGVTIMVLVFNSQNAAFKEQCRLDGVPSDQCSLTDKLIHDFSTVHLGWLGAVILAFTMSNVFRALRWQMLLAPLGHEARFSNAWLTIQLGYFANLGFPRLGEILRAGSLARYEKAPVEKVMGTMVVDRLMDFVSLCVVMGLAFLFEGHILVDFVQKQRKSGVAEGFHIPWSFLISVAVAGVVTLILLRKKLLQLPLVRRLMELLQGFWEGLKSVFRLEKPWLFLVYSIGIWLMFYLQCWFNLKAFPPTAQLDMGAALMIFVLGTLGFVIPSPGGMGTFHALCIAALALYGVNGSDAFSYANIAFFTIQIFYNILGGVISLLLLPAMNKSAATY